MNPALLQWNGVDPYAEMYASHGTYAYMGADPVNHIDASGGSYKNANGDGSNDSSGGNRSRDEEDNKDQAEEDDDDSGKGVGPNQGFSPATWNIVNTLWHATRLGQLTLSTFSGTGTFTVQTFESDAWSVEVKTKSGLTYSHFTLTGFTARGKGLDWTFSRLQVTTQNLVTAAETAVARDNPYLKFTLNLTAVEDATSVDAKAFLILIQTEMRFNDEGISGVDGVADHYGNTVWLHERIFSDINNAGRVLVHELGHTLGLEHPQEYASTSDLYIDLTYFGESKKRSALLASEAKAAAKWIMWTGELDYEFLNSNSDDVRYNSRYSTVFRAIEIEYMRQVIEGNYLLYPEKDGLLPRH